MVPRQTVYSTPRTLPGQGVHTPRSGPVCESLTTKDTKDHEGFSSQESPSRTLVVKDFLRAHKVRRRQFPTAAETVSLQSRAQFLALFVDRQPPAFLLDFGLRK